MLPNFTHGPEKLNRQLADVVDLEKNPLENKDFRAECKRTLEKDGALVMRNFLKPELISSIRSEGLKQQHLAYYTDTDHNIFLSDTDPNYSKNHPRNRLVSSSKGCITHNQILSDSALRIIYNAKEFRDFLCTVLNELALYEYADAQSSINLHYASEGEELGWHYDNSSFAITLMIDSAKAGGEFEFVKDVRNADAGEMNYEMSEQILDGAIDAEKLAICPGDLILFRGRNSMHRVTPTLGDRTRILVVLAYNSEPGISLSESARMTFFGRID